MLQFRLAAAAACELQGDTARPCRARAVIYRSERICFNVQWRRFSAKYRRTSADGTYCESYSCKRKEEEAPSGCNYLPYLNNAFQYYHEYYRVVVNGFLVGSHKTQRKIKMANWGTGKAACHAGLALRSGSPTASARTGTAVSCRPGPLRGSDDTFPNVASPFSTLGPGRDSLTSAAPGKTRQARVPSGSARSARARQPLGRSRSEVPGGGYGLVPRRGGGS